MDDFRSLVVALAASQDIDCPSTAVYAKITKVTKAYANEESFKILDGTTEVYTSPSLVANEVRVLETCLPVSTNNQYTLQMEDNCGDSWSDAAWISIEGINGNLVLKYMMIAGFVETVNFSLYSPINKNSAWKYAANASGIWTQASYDDSTWTEYLPGVSSQTAVGTQYFRHAFTGLAGMAAIEAKMSYLFGVVAYINGEEIYRDNMPEGEVTAATTATGSYVAATYRGTIRPSDIAEQANSVFAVELHFVEATHEDTITFNAYLSMLAGVSSDNLCFVLPQDPLITSTGFYTPEDGFNWSRNNRAYADMPGSTITLDYSAMTALGHINAVRVWPFSSPAATVSTYNIGGSNTASGEYNEIFAVLNAGYTPDVWNQFTRVTPAESYRYLRMTIDNPTDIALGFYEFQFLVCNLAAPTSINFPQSQTTFYRNYETVKVRSDVYGFTNCQINPTLPAGINWDSATCSAAGIPTEARAQTTYTVTSMVGTIQATGTFTLTIEDCSASLYKITRSYKSNPQAESFRIYDTATSTVIYEVQEGHSHADNVNWNHYICISQERFDVVFYHTEKNWSYGSYFYLYYILPNMEEEMVLKGRFDANENTVTNHFLRRPAIGGGQQWYYKFDSVPANWHSSDVSGWSQAARGTFPTATNKIQLYKQTFTVNDIDNVMGYILSIRYKYGCIVYLNGQEAWRNGVSGEVTSTPTAENVYTDLKYRVVTLPGKTMVTTTQTTVKTFLQQGVNTIAIALVAVADTQTSADFDAIVRLMAGDQPESHLWNLDGTFENMNGGALYPFSQYYGNTVYYSSTSPCTTNYIQISLADDRREWISSMHIQNSQSSSGSYNDPYQVKVYARNPEDADWTLLRDASGLSYSMRAQKRIIYFQNNNSYNQFRFENIFPANHATQCKWRIQSLDLYADNLFAELAPLTYESNAEIFKDIEMAEIIPTNTDGYYDYTVAPALPTGVNIDLHTGWISGKATVIADPTTYTITAKKVTGGTATATVTITVVICTGEQSLMTVRFRADSYNSENSWKLFQGRGITGAVVQEVAQFPVKSSYYYVDFCLQNGIYTLEGQDTYGDGWTVNTGYTLTVDLGKLELEIAELSSSSVKPTSVTTVFSTYFPFQSEYADWKVNQNGFVEGWNTVAFDDATWSTMKAVAIQPTEQITTYIRKTFDITNIADYQVLNIRLKYTGGVACYFNGNLVGLFNMEENFEATTESIEIHDATIDAKFHIILPSAGMVEGTNVIAFEVHRPKGTPSIEPVVFDATGVFGVEDCSTVVDSYSELTHTELTAGTIESIMDLDPFTTGTLPNAIDTYIEWTVDNLIGSKWNTFNLYTAGSMTTWGFTMYAYLEDPTAEPITVFEQNGLTVTGRTRNNFSAPVALAGFRKYKWEVYDASASNYAINSFFMNYCKASGAVCPAIDNYPSVGEGQISPSVCPEGYSGYSYRECTNGELGDVKTDMCTMKVPTHAQYSKTRFQFIKDISGTTGVPTAKNIVKRWYIDESVYLPEGMTLNEQTGEISGTPKDVMGITTFTIYAENDSGAAAAIVSLQVRKGQCLAEGVFPVTNVGEVAVYECSMKGAYVGTQQRACILGAEDGEWQKASGFCISIAAIVTLVVLVIIIIAIILFVVMRSIRKAKSIGGVKSKKSSKSSTKTLKKQSSKAVKV